MGDDEVSAELRKLVNEMGIDSAAKIVQLNRATIANVLLGLRVQRGTRAQLREAIAKRRTAGAPRKP